MLAYGDPLYPLKLLGLRSASAQLGLLGPLLCSPVLDRFALIESNCLEPWYCFFHFFELGN